MITLPYMTGPDTPEPWYITFVENEIQYSWTDPWKMYDGDPDTYGSVTSKSNSDFLYVNRLNDTQWFRMVGYSITARSDGVNAPEFWDIDLGYEGHDGRYHDDYFDEIDPWPDYWTADRQYGMSFAPGEEKYFSVPTMPPARWFSLDIDYYIAADQGWWSGNPWSEQTVDIASIKIYVTGFNIWVKKGSEWLQVTEIWTKKGGVWQAVSSVDVNKDGWKPI